MVQSLFNYTKRASTQQLTAKVAPEKLRGEKMRPTSTELESLSLKKLRLEKIRESSRPSKSIDTTYSTSVGQNGKFDHRSYE